MKRANGYLFCSFGVLLYGIPALLTPYIARDTGPWPIGINTLEQWVLLYKLILLAPSAYLCSKVAEKLPYRILFCCLPIVLELLSLIPYSSWGYVMVVSLLLKVPLAILPVLLVNEVRMICNVGVK